MYPDPNSSSQKMYDRALASLPGGNTRTTVFMRPYPIYAARGEGCRVWDLDGNVYIDCINNFTSQIHGHAHPAIGPGKARDVASRMRRHRCALVRNHRARQHHQSVAAIVVIHEHRGRAM